MPVKYSVLFCSHVSLSGFCYLPATPLTEADLHLHLHPQLYLAQLMVTVCLFVQAGSLLGPICLLDTFNALPGLGTYC